MKDYTITHLNMDNEGLTKLPYDLHLYKNLEYFSCCNNFLTSFDGVVFPPKLRVFWCTNNQLTSLGNLPPTITHLWCSYNRLTSIHLPPKLQSLSCAYNQLTSLDDLPETILPTVIDRVLFDFYCKGNPLPYDFDLDSPDTLNNIREYNQRRNYKKVKPPVYKEELMQSVFHPDRVWKHLDTYDYDLLTDDLYVSE